MKTAAKVAFTAILAVFFAAEIYFTRCWIGTNLAPSLTKRGDNE